jgi:hypothetical protein
MKKMQIRQAALRSAFLPGKTKNGLWQQLAACGAGAFVLMVSPLASQAQVPDTLMAVRTTDGTTRMSLHTNGGFYLGGTVDYTFTPPPAEGAGTRFIWHPNKAAFRSGYIGGTQWDDANIGEYSVAAGYNVRASGNNSIAFGSGSTAAGTSTFAAGEDATATGAASVALGFHSHTNARQGSFVFGDRSTVDTVRAAVNHSATWRVSGGFRIFTSSNLSTGVSIQSGASVSNWGQPNAVISTSTGAYLSTAGVWTNVSDSNRKYRVQPVSGEDILGRIRRLPISQWSYRSEKETRHLGPMAQDFRALFGLGSDEKAIGTVDADGVALAGVQALEARTRQQAADLQTLKEENKALQDRLAAIEKQKGLSLAGLPLTAVLALAGTSLVGLLLSRRKQAEANA